MRGFFFDRICWLSRPRSQRRPSTWRSLVVFVLMTLWGVGSSTIATAQPLPSVLRPVTNDSSSSELPPPAPLAEGGRNEAGSVSAVEVVLGSEYRWLLSDSALLGCITLRVGGEGRRLVGAGEFTVCGGKMLAGLSMTPVLLGPHLGIKVHSRLRLGLGLTAGATVFTRATAGGPLAFGAVGVSGEVKFDLYKGARGHTLFLDLRGGIDFLPTLPGAVVPVLAIGLGYRGFPGSLPNASPGVKHAS